MARKTVTEKDLGLEPTEEELASIEAEAATPAEPVEPVTPEPEPEPAKAEAKEPKAEPEPKADEPAKAEEKGEDGEPKTVDVRALQEARAESRELKQMLQTLEQRTNAILSAQQQAQPKPEEKKEPEIPADPIGKLDWLVEQVQQGNMSREEAEQQARVAGEQREFGKYVDSLEKQFAETAPDYWDAVKHVASVRDQQYQLAYPHLSAQERQAFIREEWQAIARSNIQQGRNPAEQIYRLAEMSGYKKAQAAPEDQPAPNAQPQPKTDLAAVSAAQQRHQSLSDAPGGEGIPQLDAKALAKMSDKEFKAWMQNRGNENRFDEIMGA